MKNRAPGYKQAKAEGGLRETVRTIVYAVLIALVVRTFAYEPFNIPSGSMEPTLLVGDYLFVSKYSYGYSRYSLPFGPPIFSGRILSRQPQARRRGGVQAARAPLGGFHQAARGPARRSHPGDRWHALYQ